ncbi:MAG TPA: 16S rRNA (cytosine(1402)-N(4))-methyltransferase RsmH [Desulfuromonadales bacterium]|nr:16S rRNA (cytosine(1402)-N(4))-methyltransferase RsmH [Desulfuromonadales bacterium]
MAGQPFAHVPVLADEVLAWLQPRPGGLYLDGTVGGGGHARLILEAAAPDGRLVGLDQDPDALAAAEKNLSEFGARFIPRRGNFGDLQRHLAALQIEQVDGVLLDIGVSSHQLDSPERGFSFREDGPLDMRMDPDQARTAADVLAAEDAAMLTKVFRDYGEERWARRIAREVVRVREAQPLTSTRQLAELVSRVVPGGRGPQRIHPATRVFQALRIFVNSELDRLREGLGEASAALKPGARLVVISFHSLEDRIVKHFFRDAAIDCICPPRLAVCSCDHRALLKVLTRRGVRAAEAETKENPRARSAVLRAVERL